MYSPSSSAGQPQLSGHNYLFTLLQEIVPYWRKVFFCTNTAKEALRELYQIIKTSISMLKKLVFYKVAIH